MLAVVGLVVAILLRIRDRHLARRWSRSRWPSASSSLPSRGCGTPASCPSTTWRLILLAALGIGELARAVVVLVVTRSRTSEPADSTSPVKTAVTAVALGVVVVHGRPAVEGAARRDERHGDADLAASASACLVRPRTATRPRWAQWNYTGYEKKPAYPEFYGFMNTMANVGQDHGCGRLMWEYDDPTLERYGTPMAPMLVSMFTDSCIGSMEGLYFESSTTTPFHFIDQRELSYQCSCAQRNLPVRRARRDAGRRAPADARREVLRGLDGAGEAGRGREPGPRADRSRARRGRSTRSRTATSSSRSPTSRRC